ncbi:MAG: membrane protein insertase YidC [Candidatus Cloacimonetes bacterium]|jgi:YidC/Oxa1 family membrane protein insertase|nr:membrane protein insertase YidC [Prolixibacteraceae bacterium]MBT6993759.1 membrane protein insertase YidC [Candidatus Cloacimonadota bacterium]
MDRNQLTGILLIAALFIAFFYFTKPSEEERLTQKRKKDSLEQVYHQQAVERQQKAAEIENREQTIANENANDSAKLVQISKKFGSFSNATIGEKKYITLENDLIKIKFSNLGGKPYSVQLKDYQTHDSLPLILFDGDSSVFGLKFHEEQNLKLYDITTDQLFFTPSETQPSIIVSDAVKTITYKLDAGNDRFIEFVYRLEPNSYMLDFEINIVGIKDIIAGNSSYIDLNWDYFVTGQEKGRDWENDNTTIYYKFFEDETDYLTERSEKETEELRTKVSWIAYKQQFFSSILISDNYFLNAHIDAEKVHDSKKYLKHFKSNIALPYKGAPKEKLDMRFYFGPNHYQTLNKYDIGIEKIIPLGWGIFGWVNRFAIIPVFNFLGSFMSSYGLIILILTILIKLVLFPLTYKSYVSSAKMRVMKPQLEELLKKIPKDKSMERQQKSMEYYKKVGVNPMGGCLPMVLQMPILIAMFRFFPSSIELRQKSFLWADDLSSYDAIISWTGDIPLVSQFYGNHISLFTLLMTISTIIYTRINQQQMGDTSAQMPGMKYMMYLFPVMMLFWFNNYASGLSYYYFIANIITFAQMYAIKRFVDDKAILKKLSETKKKPIKKSSFLAKLEKRAREQAKTNAKRKR